MELFIDQAAKQYIAKTQYGEWGAKALGFHWDAKRKVWITSDPAKMMLLQGQLGQPLQVWPTAPVLTSDTRWPYVLAGRYAIDYPAGSAVKFFQVDKPTEGKWAGCIFVSQLASDHKMKITLKQQRMDILSAINENPTEAMQRYGQLIGTCGYCGRTLTDPISRQFGIGPVCRKTLGLKTEAQEAAEEEAKSYAADLLDAQGGG